MSTARESSSVTPDLQGLRALSHPVRLRILGLLRAEGPATATTLAQRLGLNTGATSYHLRQLAAHGFLEEDDARGNARDRWWCAAHESTRTELRGPAREEDFDTYESYLRAIAIIYGERLQAAVEEYRLLPESWRDAGTMSDWGLTLTAARAKELTEKLQEVCETFREDPEGTPGAVAYTVNINAFPRPGAVTVSEA